MGNLLSGAFAGLLEATLTTAEDGLRTFLGAENRGL